MLNLQILEGKVKVEYYFCLDTSNKKPRREITVKNFDYSIIRGDSLRVMTTKKYNLAYPHLQSGPQSPGLSDDFFTSFLPM